MADKTVDILTAVTTPASTDEFVVLQSGDAEAKKVTRAQVHTLQSGEQFTGENAAAGALLDEAASATNPTLVPDKADVDTGIGTAAADQLSLIAGGVEGIRVTEAAGVITVTNDGFTELGSGAPVIKMKKVTGTTGATEGDSTNVAHGFGDISKILGYHVLVSTASGNRVPPAFTSVAEHEYDAFVNATDVVVKLTATNSGSLLSRLITALLTFEQ